LNPGGNHLGICRVSEPPLSASVGIVWNYLQTQLQG
jgi:hypothetical protein